MRNTYKTLVERMWMGRDEVILGT